MTDDKVRDGRLAKIRALMARTTANGCTEAEATAAAAAVDRLLAQYEIDLDEVGVRDQEVTRFDIAALHHPVRYASQSIAKFCDCMVWSDKPNIVFLGLEIDTEIAEYLVSLFMRAIDRESTNYVAFNGEYAMKDRIGQNNMAQSFQVGMAGRLGERLAHLKSSRDFTQKAGGFDLVVSKGALVKEAFGTLGISFRSAGRGATIGDRAAYAAGKTAADGVSINQGVGRQAGSNGRIR